MTRKRTQAGLSNESLRMLLSGACIAAVVGLFGCDAAIETAHEAKRDADKSARTAASAGLPRATDKLRDKVAATPAEDTKRLQSEIEAAAKDPNKFKELIEQKTAEADLVTAQKLIHDATSAGLQDSLKSTLHTQEGNIALKLSQARAQTLQGKVDELSMRIASLQSLAQSATQLGAQADALAAATKAPTAADVDKAKASVTDRDADVAKAQAEVDRIQKEITARQQQAAPIYTQTDAAFEAADKLKGQAAIDAGNKAMEDRKRAEALTAEAATMEPQLSKAKSDLAIAQLQQKAAQSDLASATAAQQATAAYAKANTDRVANLREQAKNIVQGDNGVSAQYKKVLDDAAALDEGIKSAAAAASQAEGAFRQAVSELQKSQTDLNTYIQEAGIDSNDALSKAAKELRGRALLNWSLAAASEQVGRVNTTGYTISTMVNTLATQMTSAFKAAGLTAEAPKAGVADGYKKAAIDAYTAALAAAKGGTDIASPDVDKIKWIGFGLQAVIQQGMSLVGDKAQADAARAAAKTAAQDAAARNPDVRGRMQNLAVGI